MDAASTSPGERPLRLALLGYGKMGKTIAELAPRRGFEVGLVLSSASNRDGAGISAKNMEGIDVCLDFTRSDVVMQNLLKVAETGSNLVIGTTGWHALGGQDRLDQAQEIVRRSGIGMVHAANFSIGAQLFNRLASVAAQLFAPFPGYEPAITETHHRFKKDAPSGTALELKRQVQPFLEGREIPLSSIRSGYVPGTHELVFDSEADTVILRHAARSRQGFAEGALYAARWIVGKKGVFGFADVLQSGAKDLAPGLR